MDPVKLEYLAIAMVLLLYVVLPLTALYFVIEFCIWLYHRYRRRKGLEVMTPLGMDDFVPDGIPEPVGKRLNKHNKNKKKENIMKNEEEPEILLDEVWEENIPLPKIKENEPVSVWVRSGQAVNVQGYRLTMGNFYLGSGIKISDLNFLKRRLKKNIC